MQIYVFGDLRKLYEQRIKYLTFKQQTKDQKTLTSLQAKWDSYILQLQQATGVTAAEIAALLNDEVCTLACDLDLDTLLRTAFATLVSEHNAVAAKSEITSIYDTVTPIVNCVQISVIVNCLCSNLCYNMSLFYCCC